VKENTRRQPTNPSTTNGKGKQPPNTQGQNEARKVVPGKRDNRSVGDGRVGAQKQENVWTARVAQNSKQGSKTESQTTPDDLAQKLSGKLSVNDEGSPDHRGQRRRNPTRPGSGPQKFSQRNPKRESGSHEKEGERHQSTTQSRTANRDQAQEPKSSVEEEEGEDIERSTSPGNGSGKGGKEKVKLSLAEFISTVGGSEDGAESEEETPSRILWVGNIGSDVTEEELTQEFAAYGKLESLRILHHRFCAFVNFEDEECAKKAKTGLQGTIIGSQYIVIKYRKPETKPSSAGTIIGTPGSDNSFVLNAPSRALWIGNISDEVTEEDLYIEFSQFGEIESVRLLTHKTCAFVNFMTVDDATNALHALQGRELGNMPIKINFGKQPPKRNDSNMPYSGGPYVPSYMPQPYYPEYHYPPAPYGHPYGSPMPPYMPMEPQYPMYLPPNGMCDFCGVNVKDTAVVPCSHSFCCNECIPKFRAASPDKGAKCYYCAGNIEKIVPISFPMNAYNPYYHPAMVMQEYPPQ